MRQIITISICTAALTVSSLWAAPLSRGIPTPEQIAWHEMELQMFLCLDPCTWQGREYDDHSTPLSKINPTQLDTDQWCRVAKSFGARQILFVAKHTGGFCWWQTRTSQYGIGNTPYKNGEGDVLAELAQSCERHGLKLGVYIYPGDDQWGAGIGSGGRTQDPAKQDAYNRVLRQQWTEVLTRYGTISEVWFDGSCVIEVGDILKQHAPQAMVFQGPHATLRWPGNEKGVAPDPTWQTVSKQAAQSGVSTGRDSDPNGAVWLPMEMDTTLLDHKWFWAPNTDPMMKSLDHLMDVYYKSVGRGCVLLLNATPDTSGRIPASHARRYQEFGEKIRLLYENKLGETAGKGRVHEIQFVRPTHVNHIITMEDIRQGQIIRAYTLEGYAQGAWQTLRQGTSVGYMRIDVIETVQLDRLRLRVTQAVDQPVIRSFAAYRTAPTRKEGRQRARDATEWFSVQEWDVDTLTAQWQVFDVNLTPYVPTPGQYQVEIRKTGGEASLEVKQATVVMAATEAPRLIRQMEKPMTWNINRTAQVTEGPKGRTALRFLARSVGTGAWEGEMVIRRAALTPEQ